MADGAHDGYGGEPGTHILIDGGRVAADPVTLTPLPAPDSAEQIVEPVVKQAPEKNKPAAEPAKKAATDNKTE